MIKHFHKIARLAVLVAMCALALLTPALASETTIPWQRALRNALINLPSLFDDNAAAALRDYGTKPADFQDGFIPSAYACYDFQQDGDPELVVTFLNPVTNEKKSELHFLGAAGYESRLKFGDGEFYQDKSGYIVFAGMSGGALASLESLHWNDNTFSFEEYISDADLTQALTDIEPSLKALLKLDVSAVALEAEGALKSAPEYIRGDYESEIKRLDKLRAAVSKVDSKESSKDFIEAESERLLESGYEDGNEVDGFVSFMELALKRSSAITAGAGTIELTSGTLGLAATKLDESWVEYENAFEYSSFLRTRPARRQLLIYAEDPARVDLTFDGTAQAIDFTHATISTPFADLTFRKPLLLNTGTASARNLAVAVVEEEKINILSLWSLFIIFPLALVWRLNKRLKMRLKFWVVPTICILLLGVNVSMEMLLPKATDVSNADTGLVGVEIALEGIPEVIVSLPIPEETSNPREWLIYDEEDVPIRSVYNAATNMIDGVATKSGTYTAEANKISLVDINDEPAIAKEAIRTLAALSIMPGTADGMFFPEKDITRAEFVSTIVRIFRLEDETAEPSFPDVKSTDWFYADVGVAQKLALREGYADGTFRSNDS
ncbi:MAG: S-layer homology domain-containing protein, partial [Clostridiales bacterium]|nr:S-layer homology domain-containing protein [Clostridiales bacterium]